jgi:hypothetical protein
VFDEADEQFAAARAELKTLLAGEWRAAAKSTLNAHYRRRAGPGAQGRTRSSTPVDDPEFGYRFLPDEARDAR